MPYLRSLVIDAQKKVGPHGLNETFAIAQWLVKASRMVQFWMKYSRSDF
jgi:hypothetical protein